jgi:hypothetical protein
VCKYLKDEEHSSYRKCNKKNLKSISIEDQSVYKLKDKSVVFYRTDLAIDADGAPKAYHPTNDEIALDKKKNGYPGAVLFVKNEPYIQKITDPAPGFYVSQTALADETIKDETNPRRYVNAEEIPYVAIHPTLLRKKDKGYIKKGDLAAVINKGNGKLSYAIIADVREPNNPHYNDIGEGSIALAKNLEINKNPKTGGNTVDIVYIIFPNSGNGKPKSLDEINTKGAELFTAFGGIEQVNTCFPK